VLSYFLRLRSVRYIGLLIHYFCSLCGATSMVFSSVGFYDGANRSILEQAPYLVQSIWLYLFYQAMKFFSNLWLSIIISAIWPMGIYKSHFQTLWLKLYAYSDTCFLNCLIMELEDFRRRPFFCYQSFKESNSWPNVQLHRLSTTTLHTH
jgi:hypothetical protein